MGAGGGEAVMMTRMVIHECYCALGGYCGAGPDAVGEGDGCYSGGCGCYCAAEGAGEGGAEDLVSCRF